MTLPNITMVGNLTKDPELRYTPQGHAVAKIRVACTARVFDRQSNEWRDGDSCFLDVEVWRDQAENIAESLQQGQRVSVTGDLRQRGYETQQGEKRSVYEVVNAEVSISMVGQTAKVTKVRRGAAAGVGGPVPATNTQPAAPATNTQPAAPATNTQPAAAAAGKNMLDEPPF